MFRDINNKLIMKNLFLEVSDNPDQVIYTLSREDIEDTKSLYKLFMAEEDFTEFRFSSKYFESFQHWKKLTKMNFLIVHLGDWREELELSVRAKSLGSLIKKAETDPSIAKYLLTSKWVEAAQQNVQITNLRGRPSKEEIRQHLTVISNEEKQIQNDYERIKA